MYYDDIRTTNELATESYAKKLSALTNVPEEAVSAILDALPLIMLEDVQKQWDHTTEDTVKMHFPNIMDIDVRFTNTDNRNQISAYYIKWMPEFLQRSGKVMSHDYNYLMDMIIKSCSDIIVGKFIKIINEDNE